MSIENMFYSLPSEVQEECYNTLETCKKLNIAKSDEWERIVNYYYERENALPEGWFNWWEDQ